MHAPVSYQQTPFVSPVPPTSASTGWHNMSAVTGTPVFQPYNFVVSGGPSPPVANGSKRKGRERRQPAGCPACQQPDGSVAPSCMECRPPGCYNCGSLDHWKRECSVPRQAAATSNVSSLPPAAYSKGASGGQSVSHVYLTMSVGSQSVPCLVDTGCELSLAPLKLVKNVTLTKTDQRVFAANGSDIRIVGAVCLQFRLNGHETQADVLVTEDIEEPMLGIDWLIEHQCYWDFCRSLLYVDGCALKMQGRRVRNLCRRVYVTEEVTLSARHQATCQLGQLVSTYVMSVPRGPWSHVNCVPA